jgi:carbon storage regulator
MLILSRRIREKIVISDQITITVIECTGGRVRLGIEAPADIEVHRHEVWERMQQHVAVPAPARGLAPLVNRSERAGVL